MSTAADAFNLALVSAVKEAVAPLERKIEELAGKLDALGEAKNPPPLDPNEYLLLPKAARESDKHPDTLRRAIKAKKLRGAKADGSREWTIRRGDLVDWLTRAPPEQVDHEAKIADALLRMARKTG